MKAKHFQMHPCLIALFAALITIVSAFLFIPSFSPSNDDAYIEQSLAGTGGVSAYPTPYTTTVNIFLGLVVSTLYRIFPFVRWWVLLQYSLILLSLCILGRTFLVLGRIREIFPECVGICRSFFELLCLVVIELGLTGVLIPRLQFTNTASLFFFCVIFSTCVWKPAEKKDYKNKFISIFLPVFLAMLGFAYRSQSGYLGFIFWVFAALGGAISISESNFTGLKTRLKYLSPLLISIALSGTLLIVETVSADLPNNPVSNTYSGFSTLVDYPRPTYSEDPELYSAAGWDESLTNLVGKWFMLDDRINKDSLEIINSGNEGYALEYLMDNPVEVLIGRLQVFMQPVVIAYFSLFVLFASCNVAVVKTNAYGLLTILLTIMPILFLGYLALEGRLIERSALAILLPSISANIAVFIRDETIKEISSQRKWRLLIPLLFCGVLLLPLIALASSNLSKGISMVPLLFSIGILLKGLWGSHLKRSKVILEKVGLPVLCVFSLLLPMAAATRIYGWGSSIAESQFNQLDNTNAFFSYVEEHQDMIYIYSDAHITMQYIGLGEWPDNQTGWGGWRYSYAWFDDAMREIGLDGRPTSKDLLRDNVCFVSASDDTCKLLLCYMQEKFGDSVELHQIDSITDEMKVYKFVYKEL
ncbi:MAG TPA: hypothetical protein IAD17_03480 [Candidatus Coprovicinus avistercoris]|uniref:Uncharacterized protein n=1 Tax=Candidatus Coprovicinus avistercoris TaxID=2840754 RepID=A0A9D1HZ47_9ACTN|nr:hypothetical protein [Candidatus Coprovicinus avistercoris]